MRMSFSSLSSSRNGLPTVKQLMGSSSLRFQDFSKTSFSPGAVIRGRFDVCNMSSARQLSAKKKITELVDNKGLSTLSAAQKHYTQSNPFAKDRPLLSKVQKAASGSRQFHTKPAICREAIRSEDHVHKQKTSNQFTVRPVTFWMDKLLEPEKSKPVVESKAPPKERTLVEKTMADSYMEEYLPLKSSPNLLEEYIFFDGRIRLGKILEDLDALAGAIAYKHVDNPPEAPPVTIVTASVDRLDLLLPNQPEDLRLSGHVAYVGKSSMEIFIKVEKMKNYNPDQTVSAKPPNDFSAISADTLLATRFTMVAIDSATLKSVKVNSLKLLTPADHRLFRFAEDNKARKRRASETSLSKTPPTQEERLYIHDMYLQYSQYEKSKKPLPDDMVWMEDTRMESSYIMQPQDRNIHNNIFGGYLMRRAYEIAFADASAFLKSRCPNLLSMDEVTFRRPVHVGSLLKLTSHIVYAEGYPHRSFQVRVVAEVMDIEKDTLDITNVFYFTLATEDINVVRSEEDRDPDEVKVRRILPRTYGESMEWLEGKRRRTQGVSAKQALYKLIESEN